MHCWRETWASLNRPGWSLKSQISSSHRDAAPCSQPANQESSANPNSCRRSSTGRKYRFARTDDPHAWEGHFGQPQRPRIGSCQLTVQLPPLCPPAVRLLKQGARLVLMQRKTRYPSTARLSIRPIGWSSDLGRTTTQVFATSSDRLLGPRARAASYTSNPAYRSAVSR